MIILASDYLFTYFGQRRLNSTEMEVIHKRAELAYSSVRGNQYDDWNVPRKSILSQKKRGEGGETELQQIIEPLV